MAIDLATETLITPQQYTRLRPGGRSGRPMAISTFYRHIFQGVRNEILEHIKIGGQTYTSLQAVQRFADRLTAASSRSAEQGRGATGAVRTAAQRQRDHARAEADLETAGV